MKQKEHFISYVSLFVRRSCIDMKSHLSIRTSAELFDVLNLKKLN